MVKFTRVSRNELLHPMFPCPVSIWKIREVKLAHLITIRRNQSSDSNLLQTWYLPASQHNKLHEFNMHCKFNIHCKFNGQSFMLSYTFLYLYISPVLCFPSQVLPNTIQTTTVAAMLHLIDIHSNIHTCTVVNAQDRLWPSKHQEGPLFPGHPGKESIQVPSKT